MKPPMERVRWYPTNTTLSTGEVLVTAGETEPSVLSAPTPEFIPEVWTNGAWRRLTTANAVYQPLYPMMFALPGGEAFHAGPDNNTRFLTNIAGTGTWGRPGQPVAYGSPSGWRYAGSAVMYAPNKILLVGGEGGGEIKNSTQLIDVSGPTPQFTDGAPMQYRRYHVNATILPDGTVLVTGGGQVIGAHDPGMGILPAEIWTPPTPANPAARGRPWRRWPSRGSTIPRPCCCPMAGCCRLAARSGFKTPTSLDLTTTPTPRCTVRRTCSGGRGR